MDVVKQLRRIFQTPGSVPAAAIQDPHSYTSQEVNLIKAAGIMQKQLESSLTELNILNYERINIYREIDRSLEHWLMGSAADLFADYACLTGDTKIPLLDGRILTIEEICREFQAGKKNYVYSCDLKGSPEPGEILNAVKQNHTPQTLRIWLDNGKYVDASVNHRFIKRDGTICRADELRAEDSLMPFHHNKEVRTEGYEVVWDNALHNWRSVYKVVANYYSDIDLFTINIGKNIRTDHDSFVIVHHKDFNKNNNNPDNLEIMLIKEHLKLHSSAFKERWKDPNFKNMMIQKNKASQRKNKELQPSYNHKIVKIENIGEQVVYDISVSGNQLFGLDCGIYVHNTTFSSLHNATVWITGEKKYCLELTKLLENINIEEIITDWAWTCASYGDLEVKVDGEPGKGIISIDDSIHPANISRVDYKGVLVGFFETPQDAGATINSTHDCSLLPPWDYVHFRVMGAKKRRPLYSNEVGYAESRTSLLVGGETKLLTTKYGVSLLLNGLPVYKRLRMSEDSLLLARLTRGVLRYIYMIAVGDGNVEAAGSIVQEYMNLIKTTRALNTSSTSPNWESKSSQMSVMEDAFVPVFGPDALNSIKIEKLGGEPDIKWITDIENLRNQLACALRVPLSLLGGFVQEASGQLGSDSIEQLDIRFARSTRRLQRALVNGITRLCQIHLAYIGMDPDTTLFQVNMSETSTTEEKKMRESLKEGTDSVMSFMDVLDKLDVQIDKVGVLDYLNKKMLKLSDFDIKKYIKNDVLPEIEDEGKREEVEKAIRPQSSLKPIKMNVAPEQAQAESSEPEEELTIADSIKATSLDLLAPLPINGTTTIRSNFQRLDEWKTIYKDKKVKYERLVEVKK